MYFLVVCAVGVVGFVVVLDGYAIRGDCEGDVFDSDCFFVLAVAGGAVVGWNKYSYEKKINGSHTVSGEGGF